jgi:hypothetical protein
MLHQIFRSLFDFSVRRVGSLARRAFFGKKYSLQELEKHFWNDITGLLALLFFIGIPLVLLSYL